MTVPAETVEILKTVLNGLISSDKVVRETSERTFEQEWMSRPRVCLPALCQVLLMTTTSNTTNTTGNTTDDMIKSLAAVVFRRGVNKIVPTSNNGNNSNKGGPVPRVWNTLPSEEQSFCCQSLLEAWQRESNKDVRNKTGDAIAEVCRIICVHDGEWTAFLSMLWGVNATTAPAALCCSALRMLESVPECVQSQKSEVIIAFLTPFFAHPDVTVKLAAVKALLAIVTSVGDDKKMAFLPLINQMPDFLAMLSNGSGGDNGSSSSDNGSNVLTETIQALVEMTDDCPKLFKALAPRLITVLCSTIIANNSDDNSNDDKDEECRGAALELVTSLCESNPSSIKKQKDLIASIVRLLLGLIADNLSSDDDGDDDGDGDGDWYEATPDDDNEGEALSLAAEQSLDRCSMAFQGNVTFLSTLMTMIPEMLRSPRWQHRYAALRAIANMAEGFADILGDRLEELLSLVWPAFSDAHPRVQYAACHALGQLCTDFAGPLQEHFASLCLNSLVGVLVTSSQPRVQCHAAAALINFAEGVDAAIIAPILDGLLERLVGLLATPTLYLQEQVIATMAAFSSAAGGAFARFVPRVMPLLMGCLGSSLDRTYRQLQCRALEAATMIALAVGKEAFLEYTAGLLDVMVRLTQAELEDDDMILDYLPGSWVRMCQVLGADFVPFLPLILPRLLEEAAAEPDIAVIDAADPSAEDEYDPAEWEFATVRGRRLGIHTATLDAKAMAVENLAIYIGTLQDDFAPYVEQTFATLLPLPAFTMHEGVQSASAEALASLLKCCASQAMPRTAEMTAQTIGTLLEQLKGGVAELDVEVTVAFLDALADIVAIQTPANPWLPPTTLSTLFRQIDAFLHLLGKSTSRSRHTSHIDCDDDDEGEDDVADDEESLMYALTRLAASLFKNYGQSALGPAQGLLQFCLACILQGKTPLFKHACLCILDDVVHWVGMDTAPIAQYITQCFMAGVSPVNEDNDTKQAAIFGLGMCAQHAPALYEGLCLQGLTPLLALITHPDAKAPSMVNVTDNAMSAVARIAQAYPASVDLAALLPQWIQGLPVTHDEDEVPTVYQWLITLLHTNHALLLGADGAAAGIILYALAEVIIRECPLSDDLKAQVKATFNSLRQQLPAEVIAKVLSPTAYTPEQLAKLQ